MRRLRFFVCCAAAVVAIGCGKATETIIPSDMSTWDKELAPVVQKLSEEDKKHFVAYVARMKLAEGLSGGKNAIPFGMTVGQAIEEQKKWAAELEQRLAREKAEEQKREAEAAALVQKLVAESIEIARRINEAVTVTLLAKRELPRSFEAGRYSDYQQIVIGIQNNAQKPLKALSGRLDFIDAFNKVVAKVYFEITRDVKPGATYKWTGGRDYNQFIDEHRVLWNLDDGQYKTRFVPETLIFTDGEKLTMPKL
ncbi:hypothetical protein EZ313_17160 [Ramlibacter henchirensis]|uniref:Lipoprotein n=1 Tax=Ramlibacter henchirensis TaxID=204072 RepID=A0A4Z0BY54_9BURK|nr:hypothetical protein [Ramlibacter henchirensis]TFZ02955.1 hypothetical protein EZ313_17160 [Ramlibacter henchirensis]